MSYRHISFQCNFGKIFVNVTICHFCLFSIRVVVVLQRKRLESTVFGFQILIGIRSWFSTTEN